jgi:23S rRNA (guanosine2251-2'-O)-methyltransferase
LFLLFLPDPIEKLLLMKPNKTNLIIGRHAVESALTRGKREVLEVWFARNDDPLKKIAEIRGIRVLGKDRKEFDRHFPGRAHQGVAARVCMLPKLVLEDVLEADLLVLLDRVTDPHNLGAILRSADAFGCGAVIVPAHHRSPVTEVVAKAASGALETVPLIEVVNLNQAIEKLKTHEYWVIGLDSTATEELSAIPRSRKTALVMGSEGRGLRQLVARNCDLIARLPMLGTVESLNVSVAAGIALYELRRRP